MNTRTPHNSPVTLLFLSLLFYFRKPKPKIMKKKSRYFSEAEWKIRRNRWRENLETQTATLTDGNCCWTITGSQDQEIVLNYRNPVAELDFYVKKVKSHRCGFKK